MPGTPYSTRDKVRLRVQSLGPEPAFDDFIDEGILFADAKIDSRLSACYTVPFPSVDEDPATPDIISNISADLAAAFALTCAFACGGESDPVRLAIALDERGYRCLEDLCGGDSFLPGQRSSNGAWSNTTGGPPPQLANFNLVSRPNNNRVPLAPIREGFDGDIIR